MSPSSSSPGSCLASWMPRAPVIRLFAASACSGRCMSMPGGRSPAWLVRRRRGPPGGQAGVAPDSALCGQWCFDDLVRASIARSIQSIRGFGFLRRSTATSWRKTSISTFFDADDLASSASQDSTRTVKRQSRRTSTVTHHPRLEPMAEFQEYYRHAGALAGHEAHRLGRRRRPQRSGSSVGSSSAASSGKSLGYTSSGAQSGAVPVMARSRATRMASVRVGKSNAP